MSQIAQTQTPNKKRKHVHVHAGAVETAGAASPVKKSKKKGNHSKHKGKNKDKGKEKKSSEFKLVRALLTVSIPPVFASNPRAGVEEMLDSMVMRYTPAFTGVVLAHSNLHFIQDIATIKADCPFAVCKVSFDATVWSPRIGMKLVGQINLYSPDHISLLVHRTFNVSIPRHHIPTDHWEFEYGAAENDPEFGAGMGGEQSEDVLIGDRNLDEGEREEKEAEQGEGGRWVHSITGARLGGLDGFLEFTVIGFTIANEMLSLRGSIQPDPFSPAHVPQTQTQMTKRGLSEARSESSTTVVRDAILPLSDQEADDDERRGGHAEEEEEDSEVDAFEQLGRTGDRAVRMEAQRRAEGVMEAEEDGGERKKKRRKDGKRDEEVGAKKKGKHKRSKSSA